MLLVADIIDTDSVIGWMMGVIIYFINFCISNSVIGSSAYIVCITLHWGN